MVTFLTKILGVRFIAVLCGMTTYASVIKPRKRWCDWRLAGFFAILTPILAWGTISAAFKAF